jgi:hypothetical protein
VDGLTCIAIACQHHLNHIHKLLNRAIGGHLQRSQSGCSDLNLNGVNNVGCLGEIQRA